MLEKRENYNDGGGKSMIANCQFKTEEAIMDDFWCLAYLLNSSRIVVFQERHVCDIEMLRGICYILFIEITGVQIFVPCRSYLRVYE